MLLQHLRIRPNRACCERKRGAGIPVSDTLARLRLGKSKITCSGFTLVEMLVVTVIIAILIGMVTGGLLTARQMAWRTRSRNTAQQLVQAWNIYLNDYRAFPKKEKFQNPKPEGGFATRIANLNLLNADRIYFELSEEDRDQGLRDAWERFFGFDLDFNYDGKVENPAPEVYQTQKSVDAMQAVQATAIAWSQGAKPEIKKKWLVQW